MKMALCGPQTVSVGMDMSSIASPELCTQKIISVLQRYLFQLAELRRGSFLTLIVRPMLCAYEDIERSVSTFSTL